MTPYHPHTLARKALKRIGRLFCHNAEDWIAHIDLRKAPDPLTQSAASHLRATSPEHVQRIQKRYNIRFKKIEADDVETIIRETPHVKPKEMRARFHETEGYVFYERNRLGGWLWATPNPRIREGAPPFLYPVRPAPGFLYLFDGFVMPHARGHGGFHLLYAYAIHQFQLQKHSGAFFICASKNRNLQRLALRVGFQFVGRLHYRRVLFWTRTDLTDLKKVTAPSLQSESETKKA